MRTTTTRCEPAVRRLSLPAAAVALLAAAGLAAAQPCTPSWDRAPGTPGIVDGYVGPFGVSGVSGVESIYAGGSFGGIGGTANTRFVARWDAAAAKWAPLNRGLDQGFTNGFITSFANYTVAGRERLVVGGFFAGAFVPDTRSIALWDGAAWASLGTGWTTARADAVWALAVWNGKLYAGGNFPTVAGVTVNGIASWDGTTWAPLGAGISGSFSPNVFALRVYDDGTGEKLYAAGRTSAIGGVPGMVARWTGTAWEAVGGGVFGTSVLADVEAIAVFNDGSGSAIYFGGSGLQVTGQPVASVVKWNGSTWTAVGQDVGGRTTALEVFNDGSGAKLYMGGTAQPAVSQLSRLEGGAWAAYDGGVTGSVSPGGFPSVFGLRTWKNQLWVGGSFGGVSSGTASGVAARVGCTAACFADCSGDGKLDVTDFTCFQNAFALADLTKADCNTDGKLDVTDFTCYQNKFALGCP